MKTLSLFVGGMLLGAPAVAPARSATHAEMEKPKATSSVGLQLERGNHLLGLSVQDEKGTKVGRISQIVLDRALDRVVYAVIRMDEPAGRHLAIPILALQAKGDTLTTDIDATSLRNGPQFDPDRWPEMASNNFAGEVDRFYDKRSPRYRENEAMEQVPTEEHASLVADDSRFRRLTDLIGLRAVTRSDADAGNIEDIVLAMQGAQVVYGVLLLPAGDKEAVVPWSAVRVRGHQDVARLDGERKNLDAVAFSINTWPNLNDRGYTANIYKQFAREPYWQVYGYPPREMDPAAAWLPGSELNRQFDPRRMQAISGTIESIGTFEPERGAAPGIRLRVTAKKAETATVYLCPKAYADRLGIVLNNHERVTVTGSRTHVHGRAVIMATRLEVMGRSYELREPAGNPMWQAGDFK